MKFRTKHVGMETTRELIDLGDKTIHQCVGNECGSFSSKLQRLRTFMKKSIAKSERDEVSPTA